MYPMEENAFLLEFKFIINMLCTETLYFLSVVSSDPLFSCIVTFCTLIFLYLPHLFFKIVLSPVLVLTGILLIIILRFGVIQRSENEEKENRGESKPIAKEENRGNREEKQGKSIESVEIDSFNQVRRWVTSHSEIEFNSQMGFESSSGFEESFVEWNVKAPLEVIYEDEEAEEDHNEKQEGGIFRYPSLSRYYPESDSDSSSESGFPAMENWDSQGNMNFKWDDEDREGLIEIALDGCKKRAMGFHFEEENLIEIDISPTRHREISGEEEVFAGEISCN